MDEFLMRTLKRIIKYHENNELELLLKPLVKKWAKDFINEKYKEGVKYYIELGDKLFTRGLIEMNSADSAQSNFANRIVSMESLNNINGYASVVIHPKKDLNVVKEVDNRRDSVEIVMKKKEESKASVVGLDIDTLNDKCVKVLKEAKDVNTTGKGVEKCLKKLIKLQSLINATLDSQKDIDASKREWFVSVESKMSKVIERFNELLKEQNDDDDEDDEEEDNNNKENDNESDSDSEIHNISIIKKNSKKHIKEEEEEEEKEKEENDEEENEEKKRPRRKTLSNKHILSEDNKESKSKNQSKKHLKEEEEEEEEQQQQQQQQLDEKNKEKKHKHHKHHKKEEIRENEEENESQLPEPPPKMNHIIIPPPDAARQRTISLPSPSDESSTKTTQRRKDLTKSISDMSILTHDLNLSSKQLSKSTSHLGKPPLSPASIKKKNLQAPISPLRSTIGPIPQKQFSPNNPFLNPQIVNNTGRERANSDQVFSNTPILTNPFLRPPPPPAPRIPNFNNPLKVYLDTSSGKLEPIEERDSNWDLGNNDLDIKDILHKKENENNNNNATNPFLRSTTPKKEDMSEDHITGKNPFESPITPVQTTEENATLTPTPTINTTPINPFLNLQKTPSDQCNPFKGLPDTNPFKTVNSDSDSTGAAVINDNRIRSNSMPVNATSFNIFANPNFMNQTTVFSNTTKSNVNNQQPSLSHPTTEGRRRFSTNPFDMVDDEDVIKAANDDFTPDPEESKPKQETEEEIETEKVQEKMEDKVEEKQESNSDLFASMFASTPEPQKQQQSTTEKEEKQESNSDLFASMFDSIPETQKQQTIEEQTKPAEIESPKKAVSEKFISSMLNTIPDNIQAVDK